MFFSARSRGFTLVELLIVAIILSILAAIVVPQFASSTNDSKLSALDSNLSNMRSAIELYYQQHGIYPSAAGDGTNAANTSAAFVSQMTRYSSSAGAVSTTKDATYKYGPYLKSNTLPTDPMSSSSALEVITTGALGMTATAGDPGGWKFDNKTGQFIQNTAAYQAR